MARIRTIKPEFWKHEELCALPEATHMLAAQLLNYADDFGYFNANPRLIQAECSPLREPSVKIPESLRSLHAMGYIRLGTGPDGKQYGQVVNFSEHQRVSHPTASKIAALSISWSDIESIPESVGSPPETFVPEQGTGNREQGREQGTGTMSASPTDVRRGTSEDEGAGQAAARVFAHWRQTWNHPRAQLDAKRRRVIREALKLYTEDDLCQCITGYLNSPHHTGRNERNTVYDDIETLLRDAKHIDAGLKFHAEPPRTDLSDKTRRIIDQTEGWVPPEMRNAVG